MNKFFQYTGPESIHFATETEAAASIASLRENGGDWADVEMTDLYRTVDLDEIDLDDVAWGDTSDATKQAMIAALS